MKSAVISACGKYRYKLTRMTGLKQNSDGSLKRCLFIMLNPSKADHLVNDPTITRCESFALREDCHELTVVNLFAYRATNCRELSTVRDPVGPENEQYLCTEIEAHRDGVIIVGWGKYNKCKLALREAQQLYKEFGSSMQCLGLNTDKSPRHPLYIPGPTKLVKFTMEIPEVKTGPPRRAPVVDADYLRESENV